MAAKPNSKEAFSVLQDEVEKLISPLSYEVVAIEQSQGPGTGRILTLFIDFADHTSGIRIGLNDCTAVTKAVDELFETTPLLDGKYTLEVSSPGVERPLRKAQDYARFAGRKARLHTFRSLEESEVENSSHWQKNQKQKNFVGMLMGLSANNSKVKMNIDGQDIHVPMELISKAHLEFTEEQIK